MSSCRSSRDSAQAATAVQPGPRPPFRIPVRKDLIYADYRRKLIDSDRVIDRRRDRAIGGPQAPHVLEYRAKSGQSHLLPAEPKTGEHELSKDREVKFAVCSDTNEVAVTCWPGGLICMVIDPALNALGNTEAQRALQERSRGSGHRRRADPVGQRGFRDRGRYRNRALSHERHGSAGDRRRLAESWGIDTELQQVPRTLSTPSPSSSRTSTKR